MSMTRRTTPSATFHASGAPPMYRQQRGRGPGQAGYGLPERAGFRRGKKKRTTLRRNG